MSDGFHESYRERGRAKTSSDRSFGLTVGGILVAIAFFRWVIRGERLGWLTLTFGGIGLLLVIAALGAPTKLAPLNWAWTKLGELLFGIANPIILLLIFTVAFVPIGWLMRAFGNDSLRLKRRSATATSYWVKREPPGPEPETMVNMF